MKMIVKLVTPFKRMLTKALTLKALGSLTDLMLPLLIAVMIDDVIPNIKNNDIRDIIYLGLAMLTIALLGLYFNVTANRTAEFVAASAVQNLRHDLFEKIESLSANQVDGMTRPSLISRMTTDTYNLYNATAGLQRLGVRAPVLLVGGIVMALFLDPVLTLVMIGLLPLIAIVVYYTSTKGIPLYKKIQSLLDKLTRTLRENITGIRVVKALSMSEHEKERFDKNNKETVNAELKAHYTMAVINPTMHGIMNVGLVVVLVIGAFRIDTGLTKKGEIIAFITFFTIILNAMMSITRVFIMLSRASASGSRINEVMDLPKDMRDGLQDVAVDINKPHIEFDKVSFSYNGQKANLENISFKLQKGQTLGIIGSTGSGKTTIINLLMRFYDPNDGFIRLYGTDIKELKQENLRKSIGLVLQNDLIFADSIFGNIQFNRQKISDKDIETATHVAQAEFIHEKELKYNYRLSQRGSNLSGGQKQRLLIARAVAGKPDILILDDASSALDYQTDMKMRQSLKRELADTTMIIVAQRISSLKDSDLILLIDDGRILDYGNHDSLMKTSKIYQELAYYQLGSDAK
ncbi:MAG TPA: ABC transporter ATP-binding protein [Acholeplasma sp.]|nr:ABC transporter ATP-binding protein [Acholeplasma sp.]